MIESLRRGWQAYWFQPRSLAVLTVPRVAICCVTAIWFGSFFGNAAAWFGSDGLLPAELSSQLIEFEQSPRWQHWSPLWLSNSVGFIQAWLAVGVLLSLLGASGIGGRLTLLILELWVIAWAHRLTWLYGPLEPFLVACLAYLIVEPGVRLGRSTLQDASRDSWRAGLATRLLQTHWWLLIAAGLLSQLASLVWWRGEGVWWLASADRSNLLSVETLRGHPALINALSHSVILVQFLALWTISIPAARPLAIFLGCMVALIYAGIADQLLYAMLLAACLTSFLGITIPVKLAPAR